MDRMTEKTAANLVRVVGELEHSVATTEAQAKRTRRLTRALIGLCVLILVALVGVVVAIQQNKQNAVASCETGNRLREGQRLQAQEDWLIQDTAAGQQGFGEDSPLRMFYAERLAWQLEDLYPLRDCTDLSKKIPEPGKPPSFKEALQDALEDRASG